MEEIPSHNTTMQRLKIAREIPTSGKSHKKRPDGLFAKDDTEMKRVLWFISIIIYYSSHL
jgi:hypothetical protein